MSTPEDLSGSLQDFIKTMLSAITDPNDAVQILSIMAAFPQPVTTSTASIGLLQNTLQKGISDVTRRAAISYLSQAVSIYQPSSYNDAQNLRIKVCAIIDAEIDIAGDQGEDEVFLALKQLRSAVVQDLQTRGASLATIKQITLGGSLPALAVAYRLYKDITRTDQVVAFADPPHPAFMPASFQALSK